MVKNLPANGGDARDASSIPQLRRFPTVGNGNSLQYSFLENPMGGGAWRVTVQGLQITVPDSVNEHACLWALVCQPLFCEDRSLNLIFAVVVYLLSRVRLFVTLRTAASQASLSFTISWSLLKLMSIELMMPSNHLILCWPLLLLPSIFPSIRVFTKDESYEILNLF